MDFAALVDYRVKLKESEKRNKYQDLAWKQKIIENEGDGNTDCNESA